MAVVTQKMLLLKKFIFTLAYGSTLYLDNISEQDQGEVTCRAENRFGITEQIAYIYIGPR